MEPEGIDQSRHGFGIFGTHFQYGLDHDNQCSEHKCMVHWKVLEGIFL